jgi:hypothetical protein
MSRIIFVSIVLVAALVTAAGAQPVPARILFIGNSLTFWNDGLWTHLEQMAARDTPAVAVTTGRSVFPGAFFKSLWERREPRDAIRTRRYDVVVLQEDLPETKMADFRDHTRRFVAEVRQAGARPVLLMAWAYAPDREHPSIAGTYLTTAILYATLFGKDPSSTTYRPIQISDEDGAFLRRIARETMQAQGARLSRP